MNVIAYDPYASAEKAQALGVKLVSYDEALAMVSVLCVWQCVCRLARRRRL